MSDLEDEAFHFADEIVLLVEKIKPLLAGHHPGVQGGALADLTATWLAGHMGSDELREALLQQHIEVVRRLIPVNEAIILDGIKRSS